MDAGALDPQIDRHGMAQVAQMGEPHARQQVALRGPGGGERGEIAVGKRQHHHVARRLAEIDRLDDVVEARARGGEKMHRSAQQRAGHAGAVEPLEADHHQTAFARIGGVPRTVILMAHPGADRLHQGAASACPSPRQIP